MLAQRACIDGAPAPLQLHSQSTKCGVQVACLSTSAATYGSILLLVEVMIMCKSQADVMTAWLCLWTTMTISVRKP